MKRQVLVLGMLTLLLVVLAGCVASVGQAEPVVVEARPEQIEWVVAQGGKDLTDYPSWPCAGPVVVQENGLVVPARSDETTGLGEQGPMVEVDGDFGLQAQVRLAPAGGSAYLVACGALPAEQEGQGGTRLAYGIESGGVRVTFRDGTQPEPVYAQSYSVPGLSDEAELEFRRVGDQLVFYVDGTEVAQMPDPGAFPQDRFYLGADVARGTLFVVERLQVLAPRGREDEVRFVEQTQREASVPLGDPLRELAAKRGLWIGAAVAPNPIRFEPAYAEVLKREFNMLTTENALKFGPVHPAPDRYDWRAVDTIVEFAEASDMRVRGHTLVWHNQLPAWVEKGDWTREELEEVLREHIRTVVGRYKGRVAAWDVVNEAIEDNGELRDTVWLRVIGPEYIELAFRWAHEADPEALLFYNDYSAETMNRKSDAVYALAQDLLDKGVPIHGVGLQAHLTSASTSWLAGVRENMERLGGLGLEVQITELDVRVLDTGVLTLKRQAQVYGDVMQVCLDAPSCTAFVLWGFTDRHSWIPSFFEGWGHALIFDEAYAPKPAYDTLRKVLAE